MRSSHAVALCLALVAIHSAWAQNALADYDGYKTYAEESMPKAPCSLNGKDDIPFRWMNATCRGCYTACNNSVATNGKLCLSLSWSNATMSPWLLPMDAVCPTPTIPPATVNVSNCTLQGRGGIVLGEASGWTCEQCFLACKASVCDAMTYNSRAFLWPWGGQVTVEDVCSRLTAGPVGNLLA